MTRKFRIEDTPERLLVEWDLPTKQKLATLALAFASNLVMTVLSMSVVETAGEKAAILCVAIATAALLRKAWHETSRIEVTPSMVRYERRPTLAIGTQRVRRVEVVQRELFGKNGGVRVWRVEAVLDEGDPAILAVMDRESGEYLRDRIAARLGFPTTGAEGTAEIPEAVAREKPRETE